MNNIYIYDFKLNDLKYFEENKYIELNIFMWLLDQFLIKNDYQLTEQLLINIIFKNY